MDIKPSGFITYKNTSKVETHRDTFGTNDVEFTYQKRKKSNTSIPEQQLNIKEPKDMLVSHLTPHDQAYRSYSILITGSEERIQTFEARGWRKKHIDRDNGVLTNLDHVLYKSKVLPVKITQVFLDEMYRAFIKHNPGVTKDVIGTKDKRLRRKTF